MAKIEIVHEKSEDTPESIETIEARVWGMAGTREQPFYIGSGLNFRSDTCLWLELLYSVNGAQIFYTRTFLHMDGYTDNSDQSYEQSIQDFIVTGKGEIIFVGIMPETYISFKGTSRGNASVSGGQDTYSQPVLEISADTGVLFGHIAPGERWILIRLLDLDREKGGAFLRELLHEIRAARQGKHPNPADFPLGSSEWSFVWQLNQQAYNRIVSNYDEVYFENPLLAQAFDQWLANIPAGGKVLDAGCGHGQPVIARLLERGFAVTGSDFSEGMLERAAEQFPQVTFLQKPITQIPPKALYDGVCSFNSMLYLDPIDLLNSLHRLRGALKPGGLLFLHAWDSAPGWRGMPMGFRLDQWMWSWHYGIEEAAKLVEEHGFFEVLDMRLVQVDPKEEERIAEEMAKQKLEEEEYYRKQQENPDAFCFPYQKFPIMKSGYAYVIIARRCAE